MCLTISVSSQGDFSKDPAFNWIKNLSSEVKKSIRRSKILFCNGYDFDELSPTLLVSSLEYAVEVGTSVFFDPGPKGKLLHRGSTDEQEALDKFLRLSDVLLLTSEEVWLLLHPLNSSFTILYILVFVII